MPEHERPEPATYWTIDEALGEVQLYRDTWTLRLKAHTDEEQYRSRHTEIVPLSADHGSRTAVVARPYILIPDITLGVQLAPTPEPSGVIGTVRSSDWEGMKHEEVGTAQGWYYPEDRLIVLWECYYLDRYQGPEPTEDANVRVLWEGFERFLTARFPQAQQLVTTADDPLYETADYQTFLEQLEPLCGALVGPGAGADAQTVCLADDAEP
jgi:hypothetical protein